MDMYSPRSQKRDLVHPKLTDMITKSRCHGISVLSLKFLEEQPQILRLTTPELKDVRGPVRSE